ncbi:MAG TPA: hypothetical protein PK509_11440, partial [Catalimonadaceae bacterium]|nr:hypothetical protein [Catalimonadaceae bacterium]
MYFPNGGLQCSLLSTVFHLPDSRNKLQDLCVDFRINLFEMGTVFYRGNKIQSLLACKVCHHQIIQKGLPEIDFISNPETKKWHETRLLLIYVS